MSCFYYVKYFNLAKNFDYVLLFLITEYLRRKKEFRDEQIRIATENGTLRTCECCCDDQLLDDDMINCDNNHQFCQ
jgi:hypothetical protein